MILLLSAWGMGGTIRTVHNFAGYLAQSHEVEILSVFRQRDEPFFPFPPNVKVIALDDQRAGVTPRRLRPLRWFLRHCPSALMHAADRSAGNFNLWVDIRLVQELRGRAGFLVGTRPGLNLIAEYLSPPGFVTVGQEHMHLHAHQPRLQRAMKERYPRLDALVALTDGDLREYEEFLGPSASQLRLDWIPNTVHTAGGATADLGAKTVLAAGRLTPQKGFDLLIRAWGHVVAEHPDWRLRICGSGEREERLRQRVIDEGLADSIGLPGRRDLEEEMAHSSIYVLSSRYEGFPLVLIEAMSRGMAVVSFDCPTGPAEVILDHENGLLVPLRDIPGLAAAIVELIEDEPLRRKLGPAAVEAARAYSLETVGPRWRAFFEELAEMQGLGLEARAVEERPAARLSGP